MQNNKPTREEDNKVVMSKLPRDEFSNFQKICGAEGKTINKKIRELINQEINKEYGFPVNGKQKKFFVPHENKIIEMIELEDENE